MAPLHHSPIDAQKYDLIALSGAPRTSFLGVRLSLRNGSEFSEFASASVANPHPGDQNGFGNHVEELVSVGR